MSIQIFIANVLRLLDEQHLTRQELSKRSGVANSFISDLLRGKANPTLRIMESISNALAVPLPYLLEHSDLPSEHIGLKGDGPPPPNNLPPGFERVTAVVTEFQAFQVKQWHKRSVEMLAEARATAKRTRWKKIQL